MCKAPKPPKAKDPDKPEWLRNPYLDAAMGQGGMIDQMRTGRSSLRTDMASGLGIRASVTPAVPGTPAPGTPPLAGVAAPTDPRRLMRGAIRGAARF